MVILIELLSISAKTILNLYVLDSDDKTCIRCKDLYIDELHKELCMYEFNKQKVWKVIKRKVII